MRAYLHQSSTHIDVEDIWWNVLDLSHFFSATALVV
jgi:hypothetical protein